MRGVSQDHPILDFDMIVDIILPMVKANLKIPMSILIANFRSQCDYMPSYESKIPYYYQLSDENVLVVETNKRTCHL
ncbi:hypothetical protein PVK06_023143 [Gossypium arboreum]|uniref:Uncharacterized protein n=1 Tax=Gossypium arboreum TaxID=29729 RepID=A0ABR0PAA1_GOSAR|nr:hypothetical protein PVK06_023143 [Gossypium arboreum]